MLVKHRNQLAATKPAKAEPKEMKLTDNTVPEASTRPRKPGQARPSPRRLSVGLEEMVMAF
jgi:hypothetical protein